MKLGRLKLTLAFLCLFGMLHAQDLSEATTKKNQISITAGLHTGLWKDLNFSPNHYTVGGWAMDLGYQRTTKKGNLLFANLDFSPSTLKTDVSSSFDADNYLANIEIGYLKKMRGSTDRLKFYLGGNYHSYVNADFYAGTEAISFFTLHGFDVAGRLDYKINSKHQISTSLSIPIYGQLVRPPYTGWDKFFQENENTPAKIFVKGKWTSLNDFVGINWKTNYKYALSKKWDFVAQYNFRYYRTDHLKATRILTNQFNLGLNLKF